jgi:hypothetical protein
VPSQPGQDRTHFAPVPRSALGPGPERPGEAHLDTATGRGAPVIAKYTGVLAADIEIFPAATTFAIM